MAGGSGTRFWPESRSARPKQLLPLAGSRTMMQATVGRLGELVPPDRLYIVTGASLAGAIQEQLPELPPQAVVGEPCRRDTAPCIGLAACLIAQKDPEGIMAVMPADHLISPDDVFQESLRSAAAMLDGRPDTIVTFGIKPTYPAEIFGYIQRGDPLAGSEGTFQVKAFQEKPSEDVARGYLDSGDYYWNSGIFVWRAGLILDALRTHQPEMHGRLETIAAAFGTDAYQETLERE
ncbi:MAG: mannose-1-phosphate guanylyltransferase, partial [Planctomycetales bacterium]